MINESNKTTVSIIIPVFDERDTIEELLRRVLQVELKEVRKEIIIVDDGSTDGTSSWLQEFQKTPETRWSWKSAIQSGNCVARENIKVLYQEQNRGKGAALCRGFLDASGEVILVQDADLEYDPGDYHQLLMPILNDTVDVVYGSRFLSREIPPWTTAGFIGNQFITTLSNMFTGLSLSDVWTGYKVFKRSVIEHMTLNEPGFELELELTSKIAKKQWRICEVPISYYPRTRVAGKKITWRDGAKAIRCIVRYRHRQVPHQQHSIQTFENVKKS